LPAATNLLPAQEKEVRAICEAAPLPLILGQLIEQKGLLFRVR
jgi:hypothetical protein